MSTERRQKRIAQNETSFRDINERLEDGLKQVRHQPEWVEFICECGQRECEQLISLTFEEYESVRSDSRHFAVTPGHFFPDTERVIARHDRYDVVEKFGAAVELADAADRRSLGIRGRRADDPRS